MTLPNFLIIGAAKAGTTAMYWYLAEHPQVHMSPLKETNFFAYGEDNEGSLLYGDPELHRFPVRTLSDYEDLFAGAGTAAAVGEASPIYLECPQTAERIRALLPESRIICGLRDPVDRAYSDYLMYLRNRGLRFDPERDLTPHAMWARPDSHWMRIGRYHELLRRYYEAFPREQMHMFLFDDIKQDAKQVVQNIYRFLGVDATVLPDLETPHNVGGVPSSMAMEKLLTHRGLKATVEPWIPQRMANWVRRLRTSNLQAAPVLPEELRRELSENFRDEILATGDLIEKDLHAWIS